MTYNEALEKYVAAYVRAWVFVMDGILGAYSTTDEELATMAKSLENMATLILATSVNVRMTKRNRALLARYSVLSELLHDVLIDEGLTM